VVNLERSILITGDYSTYDDDLQGIHTAIMNRGALADIRYTRVEKCGQRDLFGRYCWHFHLVGKCPTCKYIGNALVDSAQSAITIHGTHDTLTSENIVWLSFGTALYTEDGNEMNNTISRNVLVCPGEALSCSATWQGKVAAQAGLYLIGMTNHILENRMVGYENGIWTPGTHHPNGQGEAVGKICTQYAPFGEFRGNVCHDNYRFGLYLDNQHPRNLVRDADGFVTDSSSCNEFKEDGSDNGFVPANVIQDHFDWHNMFVGQYAMGDISFVRFKSLNNAHSMYWKTSKNFADNVSHHVVNSIFANDAGDPYGTLQFFGPSGPFTFLFTNNTFAGSPVGSAALNAGQHCGKVGAGGPCDVQYLLTNVSWSGLLSSAKRIRFGVNAENEGSVLPIFTAMDGSLKGYRSMVSGLLDGFLDVEGCVALGALWDSAIACDRRVRRLNVKAANIGLVNISGPGYNDKSIMNMEEPVEGRDAGLMYFEDNEGSTSRGYGTPVLVGENYTIIGDWDPDSDVVFEFSDFRMQELWGEPENVTLNISGEFICEATADDSRLFLSTYNGIGSWAGNLGVPCKIEGPEWTSPSPSPSGGGGAPEPAPSNRTGSCEFPNQPSLPYFWDQTCWLGKLGCLADGINVECRYCGVGAFIDVICPESTTQPYTPTPTPSPSPNPYYTTTSYQRVTPTPTTPAISTTALAPINMGGEWVLAGQGESCDQACEGLYMVCDEAAFQSHNGEIDTNDEMNTVVTDLGGTCNTFIDLWGSEPDVPVVVPGSGTCYKTAGSRELNTFVCERYANSDRQRLCWCSGGVQTTAAPTPAPAASQWVAADLGGSCNTGCAAMGLTCDASDFHEHLSELDTASELTSIVAGLEMGSNCVNFNTNWGSASDVPNIKADTGLCFPADSTRSVGSIDCSVAATADKHRICWCTASSGESPATTVAATTAAPSTGAAQWVLADYGASCDTGCSSEGMLCDPEEFVQRYSEVDTSSELAAIVSGLGATCSSYNTYWGSASDVPNVLVSNGLCFPADASRAVSTVGCSNTCSDNKRRLCWCTPTAITATATATTRTTTTTTPAPASSSHWALAGESESCDAGCASLGLACDAAAFQARNGDVDSEAEIKAVVETLGSTCAWYITAWGEAGDVPVIMPANNGGLCFPSGKDRAVSTISCSATTGAGKHRVCWCSSPSSLMQVRAEEISEVHKIAK